MPKIAVTVNDKRYDTLTDCLQIEFGFEASKGRPYTCPIDQAWRKIRPKLKAGLCEYQGKEIRLSQ